MTESKTKTEERLEAAEGELKRLHQSLVMATGFDESATWSTLIAEVEKTESDLASILEIAGVCAASDVIEDYRRSRFVPDVAPEERRRMAWVLFERLMKRHEEPTPFLVEKTASAAFDAVDRFLDAERHNDVKG